MGKRFLRMLWAGLVVGGVIASAEGLHWDAAGGRLGFSNNISDRRFLQSEAFVDWRFPWSMSLGRDWALVPELDASAGWLTGRGNDAFVGTIGPRMLVRHGQSPFNFSAGVSPTYLSEFEFGDKDFGVPLQFTSYLGMECRPLRHLQLGYRFQHMSNAGFGDTNPGLNLHMFTCGWEF